LSPRNLRILNNNKNSINQLYNDFKKYVFNNNILNILQDNQDEFEYSLNKSQSFKYTIMNQLKIKSVLDYSSNIYMPNLKDDMHLKNFTFTNGKCVAQFESYFNRFRSKSWKYFVVFEINPIIIITEKLLYNEDDYSNFNIINNNLVLVSS
jgi:hypothetical protein